MRLRDGCKLLVILALHFSSSAVSGLKDSNAHPGNALNLEYDILVSILGTVMLVYTNSHFWCDVPPPDQRPFFFLFHHGFIPSYTGDCSFD